MKQLLILFVSLGLVVFAIVLVFDQKRQSNFIFSNFGTYLPSQNGILGIDVSHHQGEINWNDALSMTIKNDSIQFVYLKVTEGTNHKDKRYNLNRQILNTKAVKVGVYHFFSPHLSVSEQVIHFTNSFQKTSLKPVLDIETIGSLTKIEIIKAVEQFLNETEKRIHVRPIIYTYDSFYKDYFKETSLENELFWIANYSHKPSNYEHKNVIAWQFSEQGTINGIGEKVDLNTAKLSFWEKAIWK